MSDYNNIPLFSVVIPTYNRADFIGIAIKSVVNQSFRNWELIVVDDGSTDNTREVVYSFKDDRIKYHFQENQELNAARNKGIMLAKGDFITFLDDDDYYLSDYLSQSKTLIDDNGFKTGIYRSGVIIHSEGKEIKGPKYSSDLHKNPTNFFLREHSNLLGASIHRDIFSEFLFDESFKLFEDIHFLAKVSLEYPLFQSNTYGAIYVRHPETRINKYYVEKDKIENCIKCIDDLFKHHGNDIRRLAGNNIYYTIVSSNYLMFAEKLLRQKELTRSLKYWWLSVKHSRTLSDIKLDFIHLVKIILSPFK